MVPVNCDWDAGIFECLDRRRNTSLKKKTHRASRANQERDNKRGGNQEQQGKYRQSPTGSRTVAEGRLHPLRHARAMLS